ncbi:hypothetical protein Cflav_PD0985, partial [Pedosphaera parvula Ellin514]
MVRSFRTGTIFLQVRRVRQRELAVGSVVVMSKISRGDCIGERGRVSQRKVWISNGEVLNADAKGEEMIVVRRMTDNQGL